MSYRPVTRKLRAARALAVRLSLPEAQTDASEMLYKALRDLGYAWHKSTGWQQADDDHTGGRTRIPAGTVRLRLAGNAADVARLVAFLERACSDQFTLCEPSIPYRNRREGGVRVYLEMRDDAPLPFE